MDNILKIINHLGKTQARFTMHRLSAILNIPYATFYRTVNEMKGLIMMQLIGHSKLISLNINNSIVKAYLAISSDREKNEFIIKQPIIKILHDEIDTNDVVLLFGSYAKGKETSRSDIDILVINNHGNRSISFRKNELIFRKKINPIYLSIREFSEMLKQSDENIGKQALKYHIVLNNPIDFWNMVINAVR